MEFIDFLEDIRVAFSKSDTPHPTQSHDALYNLLAQSIADTVQRKNSVQPRLTTLKKQSDTHYRHSLRVGVMFLDIASQENDLVARIDKDTLAIAGTAHDCGKDKIPLLILEKPARLEREEARIMQAHNRIGYLHLKPLYNDFPQLAEIVVGHHRYPRADFNRRHHERRELTLLDEPGQRTDTRARETERRTTDPIIERARQILQMADIYDALGSKRSYKPPFPPDEIRKELGKSFPEDKHIEYLLQNYPSPH